MKKTKIICTVGPSTDNVELLGRMMQAGMDLARFNFSHGSHEEHGKRLAMVREAAAKVGKVVATVADTKGPEMRLGMFANNKVTLREGDEFVLTTEDILGDEHIAHVNYSNLPHEVEVGKMIAGYENIHSVFHGAGNVTVCRIPYCGNYNEVCSILGKYSCRLGEVGIPADK